MLSGGSSTQVNHKKKNYRARGCRGGASRKSKTKKQQQSASSSGVENDPTLLNANVEKQTTHDIHEEASDSKQTGSDKAKARSLSILPNTSGLADQEGLESDVDGEASSKPILPSMTYENVLHNTTRAQNNQPAIARPTSSNKSEGLSGGGGFSFFCISPRSFLSGRRKA